MEIPASDGTTEGGVAAVCREAREQLDPEELLAAAERVNLIQAATANELDGTNSPHALAVQEHLADAVTRLGWASEYLAAARDKIAAYLFQIGADGVLIHTVNAPDAFNFGKTIPLLKAGEPVSGIVPLTQTPDSWVYRLQKDKRPCILRISTPTPEREDDRTSAEGIALRIEALKRGRDLEGFEQLIDYSIKEEAVLTHDALGKPLPELTAAEVRAITPKHLEAVAHAIGEGALRGIVIDGFPTNMIFHPQRGITIVDYSLADKGGKSSAQKEYAEFLSGVGGNIVAPIDAPDYRAAWSRVFEDGLAVLYQKFGIEPSMVSLELTFYQRNLRG